MTFGENLRAARERAQLSQGQLAERLKFKRTTPLSIWEHGHKFPGPKTMIKLATAIGCTTADLLHGVETPYDRLRGHASATNGETLTADERQLLKFYRGLSPALQRRHVALMAVTQSALAALPPLSTGRTKDLPPPPAPAPVGRAAARRPAR
jgi:transcriptional regulator with XRE-family HTH domain